MTVNPNFTPATGGWDGTTLNIPGLLPVDIGSPNPYPVTSWGQQRVKPPQTAPQGYSYDYSQGYGAPSNGQIYGPTNDGTFAGSDGNPGSTGTRTADAPFALMGFNGGFGGYGASGGYGGGSPASSYGFAPSYGQDGFYASTPGGTPVDPMAGWRPGDVTSMPLAPIGANQSSQSGQGYFDRIGSGISDRINSLTNTPDFSAGNLGQAAINAAGMVSPFASILAGLAQGFNLYDAPDVTGNPITDAIGRPGMVQSATADVANWIDRMFGGTYMPSSYVDPTPMGPNPDGSAYANAGTPADVTPAQISAPSLGGGSGGFQPSYGSTSNPDAYSSMGNMLDTFMMGAGFGGGSGWSPWGGTPVAADNNGGWGQ